MPVTCPFCQTEFNSPDAWCPHFIGTQADLTLDDYKDFISGEFPAQTVADEDELPFYFMVRNPDQD
jgi:hypothetical protein